jgi:hypothetical protein
MYDELIKKYPSFFHNLTYGIECNVGWHDLLNDLCEKITELNPPENFHFAQIKQKFGALRIYVDNSNDGINNLLDIAEQDSAQICEHCGSNEYVTSEGSWIKTLCHDCRGK